MSEIPSKIILFLIFLTLCRAIRSFLGDWDRLIPDVEKFATCFFTVTRIGSDKVALEIVGQAAASPVQGSADDYTVLLGQLDWHLEVLRRGILFRDQLVLAVVVWHVDQAYFVVHGDMVSAVEFSNRHSGHMHCVYLRILRAMLHRGVENQENFDTLIMSCNERVRELSTRAQVHHHMECSLRRENEILQDIRVVVVPVGAKVHLTGERSVHVERLADEEDFVDFRFLRWPQFALANKEVVPYFEGNKSDHGVARRFQVFRQRHLKK